MDVYELIKELEKIPDNLKRMSFEIEDKFFVNEDTICLMFDKIRKNN